MSKPFLLLPGKRPFTVKMQDDCVKEFVKERWNQRVPPEDFVREMKETLTESDISAVKTWLMDLCGQEHAADPWLLKFLFASVQATLTPVNKDELSESQCLGYIRMVIECGDLLFNDVPIGTTESALCALSTLRVVLQCGSPEMIKEAISKLSRSPYFNILVSSGRVFARDIFAEVRDLFDLNYPQGKDHECAIGQLQLLSALFSKEVNHWLIRHSRQELLLLVASTVNLWHMKACVFFFFGDDAMHLYHHMLMDFVSNRSMSGAYIITNLFVRILLGEYEENQDGEVGFAPFAQDRVDRFVMKLFEELDGAECRTGDRVSRFDEVCSPQAERRQCDCFIIDLGRERVRNLLTTLPPNWDTPYYDFSHFVADVSKYPAFSSMIIEKLMGKLREKERSSTVSICGQILDRVYDFTLLLSTSGQFELFLKDTAALCYEVDDTVFESLLLTLVSIVKHSWSSGSPYFRKLCDNVFRTCQPEIIKLLQVVCNIDQTDTHIPHTKDFISEGMHPLTRLMNFYFFLVDDKLSDIGTIRPYLERYAYLWVAVVYWGIETRHPNCQALTNLRVPLYSVLHQSFVHLLSLLDDRNVERWLELDRNPDFDMLLLNSNRSLTDLQYWIVYDITRAMKVSTIKPIRAWNIAVKWRALIKRFSLEVFVKTVIDLLVWTTQSETANMQSQSLFQAAAMLFIAVAEDDDEILMEILRLATTKLEEGSDKISDWYGLAEFCVCLIVSMKTKWKEAFLSLMEMRNKILTEDTVTTHGKWMFALCLIQIALYIPDLQSLILPDMFQVLILKHNWQTAIDFFIARSKNNQIE